MPAKLRLHAAPATFILLAMILALTVAAVLALSDADAASQQPSCGDTITTDTTLHKDLVDCPNNGILIGADNVTLDLNGHLVDGDGTPAAGCNPRKELCDVGVGDEGRDGVTVTRGSVREFGIGVVAARASHARVLGIFSSRNGGAGLGFDHVARSVVKNSSGSGNGFVGWFLVEASHHVRVLHNSFRHNGDHGIIVDDSSHNLIEQNLVSHNETGISLSHADHNQVRHNRSGRRKFEGILVDHGKENVIARNRVSRAGGEGRGGDGIAIEAGHGNLIAHNVIVRARGAGIRLGLRHPAVGGANNAFRRNRVRRSGDDGFLVEKKAGHNLFKRNVARRAGDDGFDVNSRRTKLTKNRALRNADLGIEGVRRMVDGGGNIARHNGDARQCTNIVCG